MKLFGDPIAFDVLRDAFNEMKYTDFKIAYKYLDNGINRTFYFGRVVTIKNNTLTIENKRGKKIKLTSDNIMYICPLNIKIYRQYLFKVDEFITVIGRITLLEADGEVELEHKDNVIRVHVSQITDALEVDKQSKILMSTGLSGNDIAGVYTALLDTDFNKIVSSDLEDDSPMVNPVASAAAPASPGTRAAAPASPGTRAAAPRRGGNNKTQKNK